MIVSEGGCILSPMLNASPRTAPATVPMRPLDGATSPMARLLAPTLMFDPDPPAPAPAPEPEPEPSTEPEPTPAKKVEMDQADLDALIAKKIGQSRKAWDREIADAAAAAGQSAEEAAKAAADAAERKAADAIATANARLIAADARAAALDAKVKPDRIAAFLKLADLDDIEVDDKGDVDAKALKRAIDKAVKDYPEFIATADPGAGKGGSSGADMNGGANAQRPKSIAEAAAARMAA